MTWSITSWPRRKMSWISGLGRPVPRPPPHSVAVAVPAATGIAPLRRLLPRGGGRLEGFLRSAGLRPVLVPGRGRGGLAGLRRPPLLGGRPTAPARGRFRLRARREEE